MSENIFSKKVNQVCGNYDDIEQQIKKYGYSDVSTGGGEAWNESVRKSIQRRFDAPIILYGKTPEDKLTLHHSDVYRYGVEMKTNLDAKILLSDTMD